MLILLETPATLDSKELNRKLDDKLENSKMELRTVIIAIVVIVVILAILFWLNSDRCSRVSFLADAPRNRVKSSFQHGSWCSSSSSSSSRSKSNSSSSRSSSSRSSSSSSSSSDEPQGEPCSPCTAGAFNPLFRENGHAITADLVNSENVAVDVAELSPGVNLVLGLHHLFRIDDVGDFLGIGFGGAGVVDFNTLVSSDFEATRMAVKPDGKIVIVGNEPELGCVIIQLNANGTPDTGFNGDGVYAQRISLSDGDDYLYDVIISSEGIIMACGSFYYQGPDGAGLIIAVDSTGNLHLDFNTIGWVGYNPDGYTEFYGIKETPNGDFIAVGYADDNGLITYVRKDGIFNSSFGPLGSVLVTPVGRFMGFQNLIIQASGRILAVGYESSGNSSVIYAVNLPDGSTDMTFGDAGRVIEQFGQGAAFNDILELCDGNIVTTGYTITNGLNFLTVKYDGTGDRSTSFGIGGAIQNGNTYPSKGNSVVRLSNGTLLYAAYFEVINVSCDLSTPQV